jgi:hypothetical protein
MARDGFGQFRTRIATEVEETLLFLEQEVGVPCTCRDLTRYPIQVSFFAFNGMPNVPTLRNFGRDPSAWGYATLAGFGGADETGTRSNSIRAA